MSDRPVGTPGGIDEEIDVRTITRLGVWLTVITVIGCGVALGTYLLLARGEERQDPPPSPLAEAAEPRLTPGPRLQVAPELELARVRQYETEQLAGWGWVDRANGIAQVPIEHAIDAVAEAGSLPDFVPAPPSDPEPAP
jgi:hypothetical protein